MSDGPKSKCNFRSSRYLNYPATISIHSFLELLDFSGTLELSLPSEYQDLFPMLR